MQAIAGKLQDTKYKPKSASA